MAAMNNYFPATYQALQPNYYPMAMQPQVLQQPIAQTAPVMPTTQSTSSSIIWVASDREAAMYPVGPNNAVTLWNQEEPVVYLKQADASGKPTMKVYDLVEREETGLATGEGKTMDFATKEDLSTVAGAVKALNDLIGNIKSDVESMKGDVYGLAGKKRSTKKTEEADD